MEHRTELRAARATFCTLRRKGYDTPHPRDATTLESRLPRRPLRQARRAFASTWTTRSCACGASDCAPGKAKLKQERLPEFGSGQPSSSSMPAAAVSGGGPPGVAFKQGLVESQSFLQLEGFFCLLPGVQIKCRHGTGSRIHHLVVVIRAKMRPTPSAAPLGAGLAILCGSHLGPRTQCGTTKSFPALFKCSIRSGG